MVSTLDYVGFQKFGPGLAASKDIQKGFLEMPIRTVNKHLIDARERPKPKP